jgi:translation initiation factor IF-3
MAIGKQQVCWATPTTTINCVLIRVDPRIEAEGCVLKVSESSSQLAAPEFLAPGDFVKVRLWLEGENTSIHIGLAEVRQIQNHWITLEVVQVSPQERSRLQRYVESRQTVLRNQPVFIDHLLIRA